MKAPVSMNASQLTKLIGLDGWTFETSVYFPYDDKMEGKIFRRATREGICVTYIQDFFISDLESEEVEIEDPASDAYTLDGAEFSDENCNLYVLMEDDLGFTDFSRNLKDVDYSDVINAREGAE